MDFETGHCCAHWNENTASSWLQLHGTTPCWGTLLYTMVGDVAATQIGRRVSAFSWASVFQPRMIKEISFPPASLGGAIRLKGGTMDLGIQAYYSPHLGGCSGARRKVQLTASRQLLDWMRIRLSSWPSRVFTLSAGDLNSGVWQVSGWDVC